MTSNRPQSEPWTVRRLLDWIIPYLKDHGSDTPRLDAETLLSHCWECPRIALYTRFDETVPDDVLSTLRELVKRRAKAEPVAYLVGSREFFSLNFDVVPGVLIPRPATETLVLEAIEYAKQKKLSHLIDVCSGSGCVGIAIAHQLRNVNVTAIDVSPIARDCTSNNVAKHQLEDRFTILDSNLLSSIPASQQTELIVSNPPYVCTHEIAELDSDVKDHEPHLALDGGTDGLDLVRDLITQSETRLSSGGALMMEIDPAQFEAVQLLFERSGQWQDVQQYKDLEGHLRVIKASRC